MDQIVSPTQPVIVVSGSVHYDLMLHVPQLPGDNDRISPTAATLAPGGMGGNVAAAAARLGGEVRFVGQFATDADGDALRDDLVRDGVDVRWAGSRVSTIQYRGTILVDYRGQRAILGSWPDPNGMDRAPGQAPGLVRDLLEKGSPKEIAARYGFGSFEAPAEVFLGDNVAFAAPFNFAPMVLLSVPDSIPVYLDIETGHISGWSESDIWKTLRRATVVYGNQRNLADLARRLDHPSVTALSKTLRGTLVETSGDLGCELHESGSRTVVPGYSVDTVDTTGAGDCFAAACTLALRRGSSLVEAARFANAAAALSTRALGSRPGVPTSTELDEFLSESPTTVSPQVDPILRAGLRGIVSSSNGRFPGVDEIHDSRVDNRESIPPELFAQKLMSRIHAGNNTKGNS